MIWMPEEDADSLVESAMAAVQLDGADIRCPWEVARRFNIKVEALVEGPAHGRFVLSKSLAQVRLNRCEAVNNWRLAHELGHLVLCLAGILMPHSERLATRCGRAICLSRPYIIRSLNYFSRGEIVAHHSYIIPAEHLDERVWEVQQSLLGKVG